MSTEWYCPNCGPVSVTKEWCFDTDSLYISCDRCNRCHGLQEIAPSFVTAMQEEIAALREHLTSHIKQIGGLERIINMQAARVAALEKVAKLVLFYGTGHMEIRVALREAGYLKENGDE